MKIFCSAHALPRCIFMLVVMVVCVTVKSAAAGLSPSEPLPDSTTYMSVPSTGDDLTATDVTGSTLRVLVATLAVFALIFLSAYFFKKSGFRQDRSMSRVPVHLIGARTLGPKRGIYVIETLGRVLVIGMTEHNISLLTEIHDQTAAEKAEQNLLPTEANPIKFADILNGWLARVPGKNGVK